MLKGKGWSIAGIILIFLFMRVSAFGALRPKEIKFKDVNFPHLKHVSMGLKCTACHPKVFKMKLGSNKMSMADMYGGKFCGKCHNGKDASDVRNCQTCHPGMKMKGTISWTKSVLGKVTFSHENHLANISQSCKNCHPKPFEMKAHRAPLKMRNLYDGQYCGKCHTGKMAFSLNRCSLCHQAAGAYGGHSGDGIVTYSDGNMGKVSFSHAGHKKYGCSECHRQTFKMKAGSSRITMDRMYRGENCGKCHNGAKAFSARDCIKCHKGAPSPDITYVDSRAGNVLFSHKKHFKKGYPCDKCHNRLFKMKKGSTPLDMDTLATGKGCGACHDGKSSFSLSHCDKCHQGKKISKYQYSGKPLTNVVFSHESHYRRASKCGACHPKIFTKEKGKSVLSMEKMGLGQSCGACHNGVKTFSISRCDQCHINSASETMHYQEKVAGNVAFSHSDHYWREKSCKGCHPTIFAPLKGQNAMTMAIFAENKQCGACHNGKKAFGLAGCSLCHDPATGAGGGDIMFPGPTTGDVKFSHANHGAMGNVCQECHDDLFKRKKGTSGVKMDDIYVGKFCGACHDGKKAFGVMDDCTMCHIAPQGQGGGELSYPGPTMGEVKFSHNFHGGKGHKCQDCHDTVFKKKKGGSGMTMDAITGGKFCAVCHNGKKAFESSDCMKCHIQK